MDQEPADIVRSGRDDPFHIRHRRYPFLLSAHRAGSSSPSLHDRLFFYRVAPAIRMTNPDLVTLPAIRAAVARIAPYVTETPVIAMTPTGITLKAENLHPVGAFKMRGAFNAILSLSEAERARGIIAHSSGNHAQAVAYAARMLGIKAVVVMPDTVSPLKRDATRHWGAEIHLVDAAARFETCAQLARDRGLVVIEPFDSLAIMAGTGTIGLEILKQCPEVRFVTVPVSGGGLIGGLAAALAQSNPAIRVIGVEPELANDAQLSFRAGRIVTLSSEETSRTIADGLRVPQLGRLPWANIQAFVHDIVCVSENDIRSAMKRIAAEARLVAEPSGAIALAGALALDPAKTVAILSGGNVEPGLYASILGA
jgi:threonine dehydratase